MYELPLKPDDAQQYLLNNLETLSYDKSFLEDEIYRIKKEND